MTGDNVVCVDACADLKEASFLKRRIHGGMAAKWNGRQADKQYDVRDVSMATTFRLRGNAAVALLAAKRPWWRSL